MANFRRGAEHAKAAATRSAGGKFTPTFKFEPGETKYLQFLTSLDDMATVLMHRFIIVGEREDGNPIYENFISRRDADLDGAEGYDPLIDRFGLKPTERNVLVAVELVPEWESKGGRKTITGFDLAVRQFKRDEETVEVPNVALVIESPFVFTNQLITVADMAQDNIEDCIYAIKRTGKGTDTTYTFLKVDEAIDFGDELDGFFEEFDFDEYLNDLADEAKMHDLIDPLPDNAVVSKYPGKGAKAKAEKEDKPKASTRTRRTKVEEPEEEPEAEADESVEEAADEAAAPTGRRTRKFSELQKNSSRK